MPRTICCIARGFVNREDPAPLQCVQEQWRTDEQMSEYASQRSIAQHITAQHSAAQHGTTEQKKGCGGEQS